MKTDVERETPASLRETVRDPDLARGPFDANHARLIEAYRAIQQEGALRYPVAYHFEQELGRGRQGVVFLAVRQGARGCRTRHAVKLFDPSIYSSAERYWTDMGRIAGQVSRLQPLHHDNLVSCDLYDECNGVGFVQMNAVDGLDLQYFFATAHLAISRSQSTDEEWRHFMTVLFRLQGDHLLFQPGVAIYILQEILSGLDVLHGAGYLHGDIKPSNIMVDRHGGIRMVDFGRAARIGEPISILLGSPLYMAPEVHRLEPGSVQSDLFSVGLVAVEMLGGQLPIDPRLERDEELLEAKRHLHETLERWLPSYVCENELILSILRKLLHPEPRSRFRSAFEASSSPRGFRGVRRQLARLDLDAEYDIELSRYLAKLLDPATGHVNPRMD
jgi:serine/threonine protein kinase